ncbi:TPA: fimbrial protein [Pseudomonas aeruginosa]
MIISRVLITLTLGVISIPAMAATTPCSLNTPTGEAGTFFVNGYATPSFNPSVPIGTIIDSREVAASSANGMQIEVTCSAPGGVQNVLNGRVTEQPEPIYNTYRTNVSGVGVRLRYVSSKNGWWPFTFSSSNTKIVAAANPVLIEFVKTGPITAQGTLTGELGGIYVYNGQLQMVSLRVNGGISITPKVPTCSVSTKEIQVQMSPNGAIGHNVFTGVGSVSPERNFNIGLTCGGGDLGTSTNVYLTLTDGARPGNFSNQLSLSNSSSASGVAIQILRNGSPISFGPDSSAVGTLNQWKAGNVAQGVGTFTIPLSARYIQTNSVFKGGKANASATFTLSYQ